MIALACGLTAEELEQRANYVVLGLEFGACEKDAFHMVPENFGSTEEQYHAIMKRAWAILGRTYRRPRARKTAVAR